MKRLWILPLLLLASLAYAGGSVSNAIIASTGYDTYGHMFFTFSVTISNGPGCAAGETTTMTLDGTTAAGQVKVAAMLEYYTLGKTVNVTGAGTCNNVAGFEDINFGSSTN